MLHVIHPYMYKFEENANGSDKGGLTIGPVPENTERDVRFSRLLSYAQLNSYPIMCHERSIALNGIINTTLEKLALEEDELFRQLFDPNVQWIGTDPYGFPIQDDQPEEMSNEEWNYILESTITHTSFTKKIAGSQEMVICGGEYGRYLRNFARYVDKFQQGIKDRFYIPDLSVKIYEALIDETTEELEELGFQALSYEQAISRVKGVT